MAKILIVGAGPTGLSCAIELARYQQEPIIIEQKPEREYISKAIGINARSLELLEASDVTPRLIAEGIKIQKVHMHYTHSRELTMDLSKIKERYNFMLCLPQDHTEGILEQRLDELGIQIKRHTTLKSLQKSGDKIIATLDDMGSTYDLTVDFVVGADGAHSTVRKQINQPFSGFTYPEQWNLADVFMQWPYDDKEGHGFMTKPGYIGVALPIGKNHYRLIANHPNAFDILPQPYTIEKIIWQSDFSISCRLADHYQDRRIFLAGDAAHIHTPVGGRGMNLGIEDACVLAKLIATNQWENYNALRRPVGKKVVELTSRLYKLLTLKNPLTLTLRNQIVFPLLQNSAVQKKLLPMMLGAVDNSLGCAKNQ